MVKSTLVGRIAGSLLSLGQSIDAYLNGLSGSDPAPGSIANGERASQYGSTEDGAIDLAIGMLWVTVAVASDHVQAAHRLMVLDDSIHVHRYATLTVLRGALEVSGLARWLADTEIGPRERVIRALRLAEHSRSLRQKAEAGTSVPGDVAYLDALKAKVIKIARDSELVGLVAKLESNRAIAIPDATDLIEMQFKTIEGAHPGEARSVYAMLSEPLHGNMFGSLSGYRRPTPDDEIQALHPEVQLLPVAYGAHYSAVAIVNAMDTFISLMGWEVGDWEEESGFSLGDLEIATNIARAMEPEI